MAAADYYGSLPTFGKAILASSVFGGAASAYLKAKRDAALVGPLHDLGAGLRRAGELAGLKSKFVDIETLEHRDSFALDDPRIDPTFRDAILAESFCCLGMFSHEQLGEIGRLGRLELERRRYLEEG